MGDQKRDPKPASTSSPDDLDVKNGTEAVANDEFTQLEADYAKLKNDYLYLGAEFENYKRHAIKERSDLSRYGAERFARDLLEIVDNFERAMAAETASDNQNVLREGVTMIHRELQSLLTRHGVHEVNPVGQPFDPGTQEALTSEETDQVAPGMVSRVFKKAYRLHDKLLRPAQVVVAKAPAAKG